MADYAKKREETDAKLKDKGAPVQLRWTAPDVVDGGSGAVTPGETKTLDTYGLLTAYRRGEVDGTSVLHTDRKCMLSAHATYAAGLRPDPTMTLWVPDEFGVLQKYGIVHADPFAPGGEVIFYDVQLRR